MLWNKFSTVATRKRWMDDSESDTCLLCSLLWTIRLRRHHCRVCHRLVCSNCSDHFVELDADGVSHRVCDECYPTLEIHLDLPCHTSLEGGCAPHGAMVDCEVALFKVVLHQCQGLFPAAKTSSSFATSATAEIPCVPSRHVYCVVSTAEKHVVLKTTKPKPCDAQFENRATFEDHFVVKADLSKAFESYLIFQVHDRSGSLVGKCRASLGDIDVTSPLSGAKTIAALICKDIALRSVRTFQDGTCRLPTLTYSITRMNPQRNIGSGAIQLRPDLPMYRTEIPYATPFSAFPSNIRKHRHLPLVHLFPPKSNAHHCLFLSLATPPLVDLPSANLFIPANEFLLEAIGQILHQSNSGGVTVKGVLLCTTHRLIFIQYPLLSDEDENTHPLLSVVQCYPISSIASLRILKKYKGGAYIALQMTCKDTTGHIFFCPDATNTRETSSMESSDSTTSSCSPLSKPLPPRPINILDAFQRVELEISWRKIEDMFVPSIKSICASRVSTTDPFGGLSLEQKRIQRPFSLFDEYLRLGIALPSALSEVLANKTVSSISKANADHIINASLSVVTLGPNSLPLGQHLSFPPDSCPKNITHLAAASESVPSNPQYYSYHFQSKWRISSANRHYNLCPSYPQLLVVPSAISDTHLTLSSKQRSSHRIPALTWIHPDNGAALCRSSQPLVGIVGSLCPEDETLLMSIRACTFFTSAAHASCTTTNNFPGKLRRRGYRVRRNSLSGKPNTYRARCTGSKSTPTFSYSQQVGVKDENATENAFRVLEENFFGYRSSQQNVKNLRNNPTEDEVRSAIAEKNLKPKKESTLMTRNKLSISPASRKQRPRACLRKGATSIDKSSRKCFKLSYDRLCQHSAQQLYAKKKVASTTPPRNPSYAAHSEDIHEKQSERHVKLRIVDARPYINAKGNALMGKGYEVVERLGGSRCTTLEFANIANIHVVKESYHLLRQACQDCRAASSSYQTGDGSHLTLSSADMTSTANTDVHISNSNQSSSTNQAGDYYKCENWGTIVSETKWLQHISSLLRGSLKCAEYLARGDPVLVHCSDGWDRTSQLTSLAQLLLDPEYRTINGLKVLILKDFVAFGHMFRTRSGGGGVLAIDACQESPIFIQFLDAVWQVWRQMPWEFQYSQELLQLLVSCYQSRHTSDFLYNNEAEQMFHFHAMLQEYENAQMGEDNTKLDQDVNPEEYLLSLWSYVGVHIEAFTNPLYEPSGRPLSTDEHVESDNQIPTNKTNVETKFVASQFSMAAIYSSDIITSQVKTAPLLASDVVDVKVGGVEVEMPCRQQQHSPSDENFEFRSRTYASVSNKDALSALKGLTAEKYFSEEDGRYCSCANEENGLTNDKKLYTLPSKYKARLLQEEENCPSKNEKRRQKPKNKKMAATGASHTSPAPLTASFPKTETTEKRWVHLLTPNLEVSSLLLWESVHFARLALPVGVKVKGRATVPTPSAASTPPTDFLNTVAGQGDRTRMNMSSSFTFTTAASSSLAYERGLDALCRQQQKQLVAQEKELMFLRQLVMTTSDEAKLDMCHSSEKSTSSNDVDVEDNESLKFVAPSQSFVCRNRAHSDSSLLTARINTSQLIVGSYHSQFQPSNKGSTGSMVINYLSKSSSSSTPVSSLFQRHFRFQHPTTLLFSPPLMMRRLSTTTTTTTSNSTTPSTVTGSAVHISTNASPARCKSISPSRGSVSTVLTKNRFQHKHLPIDVTNLLPSFFQYPPSSGLSPGEPRSVSSIESDSVGIVNSNHSAHGGVGLNDNNG